MKQYTTALFPSRATAEIAIEKLNKDLNISSDDISYVYRNTEGKIKDVDTEDMTSDSGSAAEGAKDGAMIGGGIGAAVGLATAVGMIPVIGPVFAAGPLIAALGLGGAAAATATGALTGALAGGLIGALASIGLSESTAKRYEDKVLAGHVLVAVHTDSVNNVEAIFQECGATDIEITTPA